MSSGLDVDIQAWNKSKKTPTTLRNFREANPDLTVKMDAIKQAMKQFKLFQHKTGAKVAIPCNVALKAILKKYDYQLPHLEDQVINRYIKEVAQDAGLTDLVEIETTKGGTPKKETIEKYKLIHTLTARRTGATLMYLAGVDLCDIMKVTGHASTVMLKKYIKAETLKVVEKLTYKYDYFR